MKTTVCWSAVGIVVLLVLAGALPAVAAPPTSPNTQTVANPPWILPTRPTASSIPEPTVPEPTGPPTAVAPVTSAEPPPSERPEASNRRTVPDSGAVQTANDKPVPKAFAPQSMPNGFPAGGVPDPIGTMVPGASGFTVNPTGPSPLTPRIPPPRIGFHYILIPGYGYRIASVMPCSAAERMCLTYGDVILALNGCPMTYYGADIPVRAQAAATDGWVTAYIHEVHTGLLVTRSANLFPPRVLPQTPTTGSMPPFNGGPLLSPDTFGPSQPAIQGPAPRAVDQPSPPAQAAPKAELGPGAAPPPAEPAPPIDAAPAPTEPPAPKPEPMSPAKPED